MKKLVCDECEKVIEGYNDNHVDFLMRQHRLVHEREQEGGKDGKRNNQRKNK